MSETSPSLKDFESCTISWWFRICAARSKVFHDSSSLGLTKSLLSSVQWMIHFLQNRLTAAFDSSASSTLLLRWGPFLYQIFQRLSRNANAINSDITAHTVYYNLRNSGLPKGFFVTIAVPQFGISYHKKHTKNNFTKSIQKGNKPVSSLVFWFPVHGNHVSHSGMCSLYILFTSLNFFRLMILAYLKKPYVCMH